MKRNIVTDSSCDMLPVKQQSYNIQINSVPFAIRIGGQDFVDGEHLSTSDMLDAMEKCKTAGHTACHTPYGFSAVIGTTYTPSSRT